MDLNIDGVKLNYEVAGPREASPVLLIHGFPFSSAMWAPLIDLLKSHCRLIAPDLRGLGRSGASDETSMASYVDDCVKVLDAAAESRSVTVVGMSMGGYIAFEFFRRARARLGSLILIDTRGNPDSDEVAKGRLATAQKVLAEGSGLVADAMVGKLFSHSAAPALKEFWRGMMSRSNPRGVAAALKAMAQRPDSTTSYSEIDVPTLIVVGEEDVITPPADARNMNGAIRGSQLVIIPQAGHMAAVERPRMVGSAVAAFVRSLEVLPRV